MQSLILGLTGFSLNRRKRVLEQKAADPKKAKSVDLGLPKEALRIRWPTRFRRAMDLEGEPNARHEADLKERTRWGRQLCGLLQSSGMPIAQHAEAAEDPEAVLKLAAGGLRANTLRKRIRAWYKVRSWMLAVHRVEFPLDLNMFLGYLQMRADEPCAKSVLSTAVAALSFMEGAGRVPTNEALNEQTGLRKALAELEINLVSAGGTGPSKQAPRFTVQMLVEFEVAVMNSARPPYHRAFA